ncbi:BirA family transcriptional regulator, biotin operon repressor / biotin-[acetyl-CoA-carboxylase] ligase [Granulicatella balaenopterae]|uniref:Bifunctional ligase/repressor BirA n=2 Tax=Granulicatella balaenopterae TaxID=137733 RepID=A0A1H9JJY0_9LACT|nr:BirA family transcriptional regulator, biotin operon repressor / biotin-[acetyl-CoA-carboxylase] ligase [Granulicatella balaenopterae]
MNTTDKVLLLLQQQINQPISGETLARQLGVSRTAIWKAIQKLREQGYLISSQTNQGYRLSSKTDMLDKKEIKQRLIRGFKDWQIETYQTIDSTNRRAKEFAEQNPGQSAIIIADEQTAGRGRLGRKFYSPNKTGLYISICLSPKDLSYESISLITAQTAVSTSRAIETISNESVKIKWVNDLYMRDKKVCGILSEAITDIESNQVQALIIGIGINLSVPDEGFPEELTEIATTVFAPNEMNHCTRNDLAVAVLNQWLLAFNELPDTGFIQEYRKRSNILNKPVRVIQGKEAFNAFAYDIDNRGRLLVKASTGRLHHLSYGEVSIRQLPQH